MSDASSNPQVEVTVADKAAALPSAGGKVLASFGGGYDGASRIDREVATWNPTYQSADMDLLGDKPLMDARARDMARNDGLVTGGVTVIKDNIVGNQFVLNAKPNYKVLGLSKGWANKFQEEVEAKFTLYAESPYKWVDAAGVDDFTSLIRLGVGVHTLHGEILASVEWLRSDAEVRPYNTAIQMIDPDRLSNPNGKPDDRSLRAGVQRDPRGRPLGYWIRVAHPSDYMNPDSYTWRYVPARKPWGRKQIIHIYQRMRPDQTRGFAAMVAALQEMRMTKRFNKITLQAAVLNAMYAASLESDLPPDAVFNAMGGGGQENALENVLGGYMGLLSQFVKHGKNLHLDGVKVPVLPPGTKLNLQAPGRPDGVGTAFEASLHRHICAALGISYSQFSRDFTQSNYSSLRAELIETWKHLQVQKGEVADELATEIYWLWLEEALNKGHIECMPPEMRASMDWYYEGLNREAIGACEWIGASRGQIDELKETQASVLRIKFGLSTREDELGKQGKDFRKVFDQLEIENEEAEKRGLVFADSDNMMNAASGTPRNKDPKGEPEDGSEDNTDA